MRRLIVLVILAGSYGCVGHRSAALNPSPNAPCRNENQTVTVGQGWGSIQIGATRKTIEGVLGKGQEASRLSDVYFVNYPPKGIQISFRTDDDTVHAIFFYNGERTGPEVGVFCGQTEKNIGWQASANDVINAYGQPVQEFSSADGGYVWQRLVFTGIDFRFEYGKMVRIGIPGR